MAGIGGLAGALSGLSAAYPGYVQGRMQENQADMSDISLRDAKRGELAKVALGNALAMLSQPQAVAPPPGAGPAPQPPMPGQPSMPPGGGGPPPQMAGGPQPGPPMPLGPQGAPSQGGMSPGAPQGMPGPRPPMPGQPPMGGGGPPGLPPGGGRPQPMSLQQVMGAIQASNPGIKPDVMMEAVKAFMPMLSQQDQMQYRMMTLNLREEQLMQRERIVAEQEAGKDRRVERQEGGRSERTEMQEAGRAQRADAAESGRNKRAADAEAGRNQRSDASREQRQQQFQQREARLTSALKLREDSTWARLDQQKQAAAQKVEQAQGKQGLAEWRAAVEAQDKHLRQKIQAWSSLNSQTRAEKSAMLKEADEFYSAQVEEMRQKFGRTTPGGETGGGAPTKDKTAPPKSQERAPAPGSRPPPKKDEVIDGYKFKGGDPADKANWEKV